MGKGLNDPNLIALVAIVAGLIIVVSAIGSLIGSKPKKGSGDYIGSGGNGGKVKGLLAFLLVFVIAVVWAVSTFGNQMAGK
jgi:hypothetical protein